MGFFQGSCSDTREPPNSMRPLCACSSTDTDHYCDHNELQIRTSLRKMIGQLGLACFLPSESNKRSKIKNANLEHNKAWLLAESGGCGGAELTNADPQSVHSSFRFSFCSQVELESMNVNSSASTTVLMVNLDNGLNETRAKELKWRRIQSLERSIYPVANSLVRFSYNEILAATCNFSKGTKVLPLSSVLSFILASFLSCFFFPILNL